jgi:hypothetical protein
MTITVIQAPSTNLAAMMIASAAPVAIAPKPLMARLPRLRLPFVGVLRVPQRAPPMQRHAGLRQGEGEKGPDREQRDQPVGDAVERHEQQPALAVRNRMPAE